MSTEPETALIDLTANIAAAYVSKNSIQVGDIPALIVTIYQSLNKAGQSAHHAEESEQPKPAVPVKKSVHPEYIVCLEDGKKLKMLKRHLSTHYDLTPDEYREKWGLPKDYPMTAPNYARQRSALAVSIGLGTKKAA